MINTELLLAAWLEKLQKKWDTEEYYYDVEEAKKVFKFDQWGSTTIINRLV